MSENSFASIHHIFLMSMMIIMIIMMIMTLIMCSGEATLQADSASRSSMIDWRNTSQAWRCCLRALIILSPGQHDDDDDDLDKDDDDSDDHDD